MVVPPPLLSSAGGPEPSCNPGRLPDVALVTAHSAAEAKPPLPPGLPREHASSRCSNAGDPLLGPHAAAAPGKASDAGEVRPDFAALPPHVGVLGPALCSPLLGEDAGSKLLCRLKDRDSPKRDTCSVSMVLMTSSTSSL